MSVSGIDLERVDVVRLADRAQTLKGQWPGLELTRLSSDLAGPPGEVLWSARGEFKPVMGSKSELWLHLDARVVVPMTCQRCLDPVPVPLSAARSYRFVRDEAQAQQQDEESEEDVLAIPPEGLDLRALIEDELILSLPLVPKHQDCVSLAAAGAQSEVIDERVNPFLALAALKRDPPDGGAK